MLVGLELRGLFRKDAVKAVGLGLAIVALLLYLDFRRLSLTLFAMLQLGAGVSRCWAACGCSASR